MSGLEVIAWLKARRGCRWLFVLVVYIRKDNLSPPLHSLGGPVHSLPPHPLPRDSMSSQMTRSQSNELRLFCDPPTPPAASAGRTRSRQRRENARGDGWGV